MPHQQYASWNVTGSGQEARQVTSDRKADEVPKLGVDPKGEVVLKPGTGREHIPGIRAILLVGVLSFKLPGRRQQRDAIREHWRGNDASRATLRFVLASDEADADADSEDMLLFDVSNQSRHTLGKLLLQNAFFRFALQPRHRVKYIARADDDAIFNASSLVDDLMLLMHFPYVVYGPFRNWYQWMPREMIGVCWSSNPGLFLKVRNRHELANSSRENATHPCYFRGTTGSFPFAAGPLMVFSRSVVRLFAPLLPGELSGLESSLCMKVHTYILVMSLAGFEPTPLLS